jgi:hypothetical protein
MLPLRCILVFALTAPGCFPNLDAKGHDRCFEDADCLDGRVCVTAAGEEPGTCGPPAADTGGPEPECAPYDQDNDGAYTQVGCGQYLDCDDGDDRRSPALPEFCDGIDNDCDEEIDEGLRNACGGCSPLPSEVCDGRDEDCDGVIDDGQTNACGQCGAALPEWCDGEDNDCNGMVDEGLDCTCQEGAERGCPNAQEVTLDLCRQGRQSCEDGRWGTCRNPEITTGQEICDAHDNDCDGEVDEDFDLDADRSNCGACRAICSTLHAQSAVCVDGACQISCQSGFLDLDAKPHTGCEYPCEPTGPETCDNGLDDNCDGDIDPGCDTARLGGTYAWINLFGRAAPRQPPGLVTGILTAKNEGDPSAEIHNLVRVTAEDGLLQFSRTSTRRVVASPTGTLELRPTEENDPIGGAYRGRFTPDPARSVAVLMEYDGDRQIASMALMIRTDYPAVAKVEHTHIRGPYHALHFLPGRLLTGRRDPDPITIEGWSLDASAPLGVGTRTFALDGTTGLSPGGPNSASYRGADGQIDISFERAESTARYTGATESSGGFAVLTFTPESDEPTTDVPEPGLVLLIERRTDPDLDDLVGTWTLAGLQTRYDGEEDEIRYNAIQEQLTFQAPSTGDYLSVLQDINDVTQDVGTVTVGTASTGEPHKELRLTLMTRDNLDGPRIELRGSLNARADLAVFWEIDDLGDQLPVTSLFVAVRHGTNSE